MQAGMKASIDTYNQLLKKGASRQDARGILPMATSCNLLAKYNLRSFVDLVHSRMSLRTQAEYRDIVFQAQAAVLRVWPWAKAFLEPKCSTALRMLDDLAQENGLTQGSGTGWKLAKIADLIRKGE